MTRTVSVQLHDVQVERLDRVARRLGRSRAEAIRTLLDEAPGKEDLDRFVEQMMLLDTLTYLPDDILVKVDRASMAHGLEVRPPLLDHELMEFACRIPSRWKVRGGETKWIFKKAAEAYRGHRYNKPVGTVPAYVNDAQRQATIEAARAVLGLLAKRPAQSQTAGEAGWPGDTLG